MPFRASVDGQLAGRVVDGIGGPIAAEDLGETLVHEHLLIDLRQAGYAAAVDDPGFERIRVTEGSLPDVRRRPFAFSDNLVLCDVDLIVEELAPLPALGFRTIVDLTPSDTGRSPSGLREIAGAAGMQIVMGTGHYRSFAHPVEVATTSTAALVDELIGDLTVGVDAVRAGVIGEIGTFDPIHPDEARVLEAASIAQRETGRTLFVHVHPWTRSGHDILDHCEAAGADATRVVLSHIDAALPDTAYPRSLAGRGAWVSFDLFGDDRDDYEGRRFPTDAARIAGVVAAFEEGWADRLLLSHDIALKTRLWRYGGCGFDHLATRIVPRLRSAGLAQADVDALFIRNPAVALSHPVDDPIPAPTR